MQHQKLFPLFLEAVKEGVGGGVQIPLMTSREGSNGVGVGTPSQPPQYQRDSHGSLGWLALKSSWPNQKPLHRSVLPALGVDSALRVLVGDTFKRRLALEGEGRGVGSVGGGG